MKYIIGYLVFILVFSVLVGMVVSGIVKDCKQASNHANISQVDLAWRQVNN
jgi:competence protein ComGC